MPIRDDDELTRRDFVVFNHEGKRSSAEAALRLAKMSTGGFEVLAFDAAWHGKSASATFVAGDSCSGSSSWPTASRNVPSRVRRGSVEAVLELGLSMNIVGSLEWAGPSVWRLRSSSRNLKSTPRSKSSYGAITDTYATFSDLR